VSEAPGTYCQVPLPEASEVKTYPAVAPFVICIVSVFVLPNTSTSFPAANNKLLLFEVLVPFPIMNADGVVLVKLN